MKKSKENLINFSRFVYICWVLRTINPLSANSTKWSNTLKQFVGNSVGTLLNAFYIPVEVDYSLRVIDFT